MFNLSESPQVHGVVNEVEVVGSDLRGNRLLERFRTSKIRCDCQMGCSCKAVQQIYMCLISPDL